MYEGTLLITTGTTDEINRALLDLLKKINLQSETLDKINERLSILESKIEKINN